ncbi:acyltransferase family protein [Teichococcus oryzae]|nr:acyltransferase family protein [Pseudoroseomonas oryzae]
MSATPPPPRTSSAGGSQRWNYLDQMRAILMLIGIPYHVGLIYATHAPWIIDSPDKSEGLTWALQFSHTFRMSVFFLLAGFFGMLMIRRYDASTWLKGRLWRVGVPLVAALVLISPMIVIPTAIGQGGWDNAIPGLLAAMRNPDLNWTVHLWFLMYLLGYCVLLAGLWQLRGPLRLERGLNMFLDAVERHPVVGWLAVLATGVASVGFAGVAALAGVSYMFNEIFVPGQFVAYGLVFLAGTLLAYRLSWLEAFTRPRWSIWALAVASAITMAVFQPQEDDASRLLTYFLWPMVGILFSHLLLSAARMWLDRSTSLSRAMVEGAMTMYLVHVVFVCWLGLAFLSVEWPAMVEFTIISVAAVALSWGFHLIVRRSPVLMMLFNGRASLPAAHGRLSTATS